MNPRHARIVPLVLFIAALISRVTTAAILLHNHGPDLFYQGNEPSYIASHIAAGKGFSSPYENTPIAPTAQQPPLYPALIAAVFWIFGSFTVRSLWILLAIHSIAGAATAVLIYLCGARHFTRRIGLFAACFWILWPYESLFDAPIAIYGLSALVVSLWFLVAPRILAESNSNRDWLLLGLGAGLALLLNPTLAPVFLASVVWLRWRESLTRLLLISGTAVLLVLTPWTIRNYRCFHRLIPLRNTLGAQMYAGNQPGMTGDEQFGDDFPSHNPQQFSELGEIKYMDLKKAQAFDYIRQDPKSFLRRTARRTLDFWLSPGFIPWGVVSILALAGIGVLLQHQGQRRMGIFLSLVFLLFPVVYYISRFWTIYRHPIEPLMLLAAFSAIEHLSRPRSQRSNLSQTDSHLQMEHSSL